MLAGPGPKIQRENGRAKIVKLWHIPNPFAFQYFLSVKWEQQLYLLQEVVVRSAELIHARLRTLWHMVAVSKGS